MSMTDLAELERRIGAALDRIAQAAENLPEPAAEPEVPAGPSSADVEAAELAAALREELEAERSASAQLGQRLSTLRQRHETRLAVVERKLARANEQLDIQGFELQRLKRANAQLAEANRRLMAAQETGSPDPGAASRALQAELDALRAARRSEMAELEEIMAELAPLVDAAPAAGQEASHG
jgi:DNA repair exonuclease SbcCD ATPase subunit